MILKTPIKSLIVEAVIANSDINYLSEEDFIKKAEYVRNKLKSDELEYNSEFTDLITSPFFWNYWYDNFNSFNEELLVEFIDIDTLITKMYGNGYISFISKLYTIHFLTGLKSDVLKESTEDEIYLYNQHLTEYEVLWVLNSVKWRNYIKYEMEYFQNDVVYTLLAFSIIPIELEQIPDIIKIYFKEYLYELLDMDDDKWWWIIPFSELKTYKELVYFVVALNTTNQLGIDVYKEYTLNGLIELINSKLPYNGFYILTLGTTIQKAVKLIRVAFTLPKLDMSSVEERDIVMEVDEVYIKPLNIVELRYIRIKAIFDKQNLNFKRLLKTKSDIYGVYTKADNQLVIVFFIENKQKYMISLIQNN
jgi:hypothetical protein